MQGKTNILIPFVSGHKLTLWLSYVLLFYIGVTLVSDFLLLTQAEQPAIYSWRVMTYVLSFLLNITIAILFLIWFGRVHRNLPSLGAHNLRYTPGWAVGGFFVPFLNFVRPLQVAKEVWQASEPNASERMPWQDWEPPPLIDWWWGTFLLSRLLGYIASLVTREGSIHYGSRQELLFISLAVIVAAVFEIAAAILVIVFMNKIDQRQESRFMRVSTIENL
jgi:hypothetical protein